MVRLLTDQHNLIKDMFDDVIHASGPKAREKAFIDLRKCFAVHETAEEMVVHPRARNEITDGDAVVDARLQEEHSAKEQLAKLESMDIASQEFLDELLAFRDAVIDHAEQRRAGVRQAAGQWGADDLKRMAAAVRAAEAIAPTRHTREWSRPSSISPSDRSPRCSTAPGTQSRLR